MPTITKDDLQQLCKKEEMELLCTHLVLCLPIVERLYRKMLAGIRFPAIKVDDKLICDGHHRYLASLLAKRSIEKISFKRTNATMVTESEVVVFDETDWDTPARVRQYNKADAAYNSITLAVLLDKIK